MSFSPAYELAAGIRDFLREASSRCHRVVPPDSVSVNVGNGRMDGSALLPISDEGLDDYANICANQESVNMLRAVLFSCQAEDLESQAEAEDAGIPDLSWIDIESVLKEPERAADAIGAADEILGSPLEQLAVPYRNFVLGVSVENDGGKLAMSVFADFANPAGSSPDGKIVIREVEAAIPENRKRLDAVLSDLFSGFPKLKARLEPKDGPKY